MIMADEDYRVVQFFLTSDDELPAVYEVGLLKVKKVLVCTCPGYRGRKICKHVAYVKDRVLEGGESSHYTMKLDPKTPDDVISRVPAMTKEEYRDFVIQYGSIEVL